MFKNKVIAFILLAAIFTSAKAFCQQDIKDKQSMTIAGRVTDVDVAGDVINVKTNSGKMAFSIAVESELLRYAHHIASIEIEKGDPVIIEYATTSLGQNIIIRLEDNRQETS